MRQYQIIFGEDESKTRFEKSGDRLLASKSFEPTGDGRIGFFAEANFQSALEDFSPLEFEPTQKFAVILAQLDRIVCLDEMSENLDELDAAVKTGNAARIGALARDCAEMCRDCEMASAIEPLLELARLCRRNQTARAAALCAKIKSEFEQRRLIFKTNLRRLASGGKTNRRAFV